jgi:hypothetical protein
MGRGSMAALTTSVSIQCTRRVNAIRVEPFFPIPEYFNALKLNSVDIS